MRNVAAHHVIMAIDVGKDVESIPLVQKLADFLPHLGVGGHIVIPAADKLFHLRMQTLGQMAAGRGNQPLVVPGAIIAHRPFHRAEQLRLDQRAILFPLDIGFQIAFRIVVEHHIAHIQHNIANHLMFPPGFLP